MLDLLLQSVRRVGRHHVSERAASRRLILHQAAFQTLKPHREPDTMDFSPSLELRTAMDLARQAGRFILPRFRQGLHVDRKAGEEPVTEADRGSCEIVVTGLGDAFPQDSILSEEMPFVAGEGDRLWCVDPLDGTQEFVDGVGQFSVMIGLTRGGRPILGVAALIGTIRGLPARS